MKRELSRELLNTTLATLVLTVISLFLVLFLKSREPRDVFLHVKLSSTEAGVSQVFFDTGSGYSEAESVRVSFAGGSSLRTLRFALPDRSIKSIRFDPTSTAAGVDIVEASICARNGLVLQKLALEQFAAIAPTAEAVMDNDGLKVRVPEGSVVVDPQMAVKLDYPFELSYGLEVYYGEAIADVATYGAGILLVYLWLRVLTGMHLFKMVLSLPGAIRSNFYLVNRR
jgi:hypothetical protein